MPKRAERRHHEDRVKNKFKKVAKRWAGRYDSWAQRWDIRWENGKIVYRQHVIDATGYTRRMQFIERTAAKLAHHSKCDCWMCHGEKYDRKQKKAQDALIIKEDTGE